MADTDYRDDLNRVALVDMQRFEDYLCTSVDPQFLRRFIDSFERDAMGTIHELQALARSPFDAQSWCHQTHILKGLAGDACAQRLFETAVRLELITQNSDAAHVQRERLTGELTDMLDRTLLVLKQKLR